MHHTDTHTQKTLTAKRVLFYFYFFHSSYVRLRQAQNAQNTNFPNRYAATANMQFDWTPIDCDAFTLTLFIINDLMEYRLRFR